MCTVSYIPTLDGFYLTSNRDESPNRETLNIQHVKLSNGKEINAPIDQEKKGTWIASDENGKVACLLNGGFEKHKRKLPYRKSRGHFILEAFEYNSFSEFIEQTDLKNIEPFTIILIDDFLQVLVWDGEKKHRLMQDKNVPQLWSSSTLYTREEHIKKHHFFMDSLKGIKPESKSILKIHGLNNSTPFVLNLPHVKTVSITHFVMNSKKSQLTYHLKVHKDEQKTILH